MYVNIYIRLYYMICIYAICLCSYVNDECKGKQSSISISVYTVIPTHTYIISYENMRSKVWKNNAQNCSGRFRKHLLYLFLLEIMAVQNGLDLCMGFTRGGKNLQAVFSSQVVKKQNNMPALGGYRNPLIVGKIEPPFYPAIHCNLEKMYKYISSNEKT